MISITLTTKDKWEKIWAGVILPNVRKPSYDTQNNLIKYLPKNDAFTFIEIGCAPGGWMAYFKKIFGYQVSGIEYAEAAAEATKLNMRLLGIDAEVIVQDLLMFDHEKKMFDVVFSAGFIEHFRDISQILEKIISISRKYVVTIVPNVFGINGFISKSIRPKIYKEHVKIDVATLKYYHSIYGIKTLYCNYVGGAKLIMPGVTNDILSRDKKCTRHYIKLINTPFRVFNCISENMQRIVEYAPKSKLISSSLMYIGIKNNI